MKVAVIAVAIVLMATITLAQQHNEQPNTAYGLLESVAPGDYAAVGHQPESFAEAPQEGLVRNKRQFGYGGYGGYGGGYRRGYGGGGYGGGFRGGYGYSRGFYGYGGYGR